jgi:hypothetical protein
VERAALFGVGWVLGAGAAGGLLGSIADGVTGLIIWGLSGIAVGAVQWALVSRRLQIPPIRWIVATSIGSFATLYVHFYLGVLITKGARSFFGLMASHGGELLFNSVIVAIAGGLLLGIPQASALGRTPIRWWTWPLATMLGALVAWLADLGLWSVDMPRRIEAIIRVGGYWVALSLPQAFLIGWALRRQASPTTAKTVS